MLVQSITHIDYIHAAYYIHCIPCGGCIHCSGCSQLHTLHTWQWLRHTCSLFHTYIANTAVADNGDLSGSGHAPCLVLIHTAGLDANRDHGLQSVCAHHEWGDGAIVLTYCGCAGAERFLVPAREQARCVISMPYCSNVP